MLHVCSHACMSSSVLVYVCMRAYVYIVEMMLMSDKRKRIMWKQQHQESWNSTLLDDQAVLSAQQIALIGV